MTAGSPDAATSPIAGLPFGAGELAEALEAGVRGPYESQHREPLMRGICEVSSLAIKQILEEHDIEATLMISGGTPNVPASGRYHVMPLAELAGKQVSFDCGHGQLLSSVGRSGVDRTPKRLEEQFGQSGAKCVVFEPETYQAAIRDTMIRIFGTEADESLMARAYHVYGQWWHPTDPRPYEPDANMQKWAAGIMPIIRNTLKMN